MVIWLSKNLKSSTRIKCETVHQSVNQSFEFHYHFIYQRFFLQDFPLGQSKVICLPRGKNDNKSEARADVDYSIWHFLFFRISLDTPLRSCYYLRNCLKCIVLHCALVYSVGEKELRKWKKPLQVVEKIRLFLPHESNIFKNLPTSVNENL